MRYVSEFRAAERVRALAERIAAVVTREWTVMEICGGQTHAIARYGVEDLLPPGITLVHGPGCPVCVTPVEVLEQARRIALEPGTVLCTYGDMMRVPAIDGDLLGARAEGADVRIVLSPLDAVTLAGEQRDREVVFLSVGFETTAPAAAAAIDLAATLGLDNFSVVAAHVRVPPAIEAILAAPDNAVQAFLAAGHVCTVAGTGEYPDLARRFGVPIVVTGFEPVDILEGLLAALRQLENGDARVENRYERAVRAAGNPVARASVERVFEVSDRPWRGLGVLPRGGLAIREAWARFDATRRFAAVESPPDEPVLCRAAEVLRGRLRPDRCPEFASRCTPERPLGAPMVSSEGACAAYHRYRARVSA